MSFDPDPATAARFDEDGRPHARTVVWLDKRTNAQMSLANGTDAPGTVIQRSPRELKRY